MEPLTVQARSFCGLGNVRYIDQRRAQLSNALLQKLATLQKDVTKVPPHVESRLQACCFPRMCPLANKGRVLKLQDLGPGLRVVSLG